MKQTITIVLCLYTVITYAQKNKKTKFDMADFDKKFEVAEWLCRYDMVAWWTSDSVMTQDKKEIKRLGKEWFCFEDKNNTWHAVYGKYDNGSFDQVFHFTVDSNATVKRINDKIDTLTLNTYSRALIIANKQISSLKDSVGITFNQFIKQNDDKTFSVWLLPAFQSNGTAIYGAEFIYTIGPTGNNILKDNSYYNGNLRGFKVDKPKEIWLNYEDTDKPTLGAIFFVWYYKQYFTSIYIDCSKSKSTVYKYNGDKYTWIHAEKDTGNNKKD